MKLATIRKRSPGWFAFILAGFLFSLSGAAAELPTPWSGETLHVRFKLTPDDPDWVTVDFTESPVAVTDSNDFHALEAKTHELQREFGGGDSITDVFVKPDAETSDTDRAKIQKFFEGKPGYATIPLETSPAWKVFARSVAGKPLTSAWQYATITTTYRELTSFKTYLHNYGDIRGGSGLVYWAAYTFGNGLFRAQLSKAFRYRFKNPAHPYEPTDFVPMVRRRAYSFINGAILRAITGAPQGAHAVTTGRGLAEIAASVLLFGTVDTKLDLDIEKAYGDAAHVEASERVINRTILLSFATIVPWQMIDSAGGFPVLWDAGVIQFRATNLAMLTTYGALMWAVRKHPETVKNFVTAPIWDQLYFGITRPATRIIAQIQGSAKAVCRWITGFHAP